METTKHFYRNTLGFSVTKTEYETFSASKEGCTILFTQTDLWPGVPNCTGTIYLFIANVDAYYDSVKNDVHVMWPLQDMPYGVREFGIKDNNDYHLAFAQRSV